MTISARHLAPALALLASSVLAQPYRTTPIQITADLSEGFRKLYHAEIDIPVTAGPITLTTPKWIPGNHRPTGPVDEITGVVFTANGQTLEWRRDNVNLYEFHVTVPKGITTLHAHLDCIVTARVSQKLAVLEWEKLLLYPTGLPVRDIPVQPTVIVPAGWGVGTALQPTGPATSVTASALPGSSTKFATTTVEQLEDSPIITGQYFHEFPLAPEVTPKHFIDVVADAPEDSNLNPRLLAELGNLVRETGAAYNSRHYNTYHLLLTLSDVAGGEGLEHGQSSDNGTGEKAFSNPDRLASADLLAHEFTHSWNGKYRRPARLYQNTFFEPEQGDLLWVYEGMTQYMGNVLAARSGLETPAQYRDKLAASAANLDTKTGRQWRSTEDTAIAASILRGGDPAWSNWKRGQDYYQEGELLWLDADTLIRKGTDNKKSLTDFQHIFLGKGGTTGPLIAPYERPELIADLNQVYPYDWAKFLHDRVDVPTPRADLSGIELGGYKLVYLDHAPASERATDAPTGRGPRMGPNVWYSLGLRLTAEGTISDVRFFSAADKAKLFPGQKIVGVNGQAFSSTILTDAIKAAKGKTEPIHLILQADTFLTMASLPYFDGEKYPALERTEGTPAYLDDIIKPLTTPDPASLPPARPGRSTATPTD